MIGGFIRMMLEIVLYSHYVYFMKESEYFYVGVNSRYSDLIDEMLVNLARAVVGNDDTKPTGISR